MKWQIVGQWKRSNRLMYAINIPESGNDNSARTIIRKEGKEGGRQEVVGNGSEMRWWRKMVGMELNNGRGWVGRERDGVMDGRIVGYWKSTRD